MGTKTKKDKAYYDRLIKEFDRSLEDFRFKLTRHLDTFLPLSDDYEEKILKRVQNTIRCVKVRPKERVVDPFESLNVETIIQRIEWEMPSGIIKYLAITYDSTQFEIWELDGFWRKVWTNLHDWKTIMDRLRRTIETILGI